jgi:tetratricopeptide (TPR) repeat protein
VTALRMLAEVAARLKRFGEAERLLALCLQLAPGFHAARHNYAHVLHRQNRGAAALEQIDWLLERVPGNPGYRNLKAAILAALGEHDAALRIYEQILAGFAHQSRLWMSYGHTLKTAGRSDDGVAAYRRAIELEPSLGEAYWSLANLKTFRFTAAEVAAMRGQLQRADLGTEDRYHFEFALGKALEDESQYAESFAHYSEGNRLRRSLLNYDAEESSGRLRRSQKLFSPAFFAARSGYGCQARDPIFIVGLPRSGSTLIEQILASHSAVEGTAELPDIITMAREIGAAAAPALRYPAPLAELTAPQCLALGERYTRDTKVQRKTDRPRFIDKMPNNFPHIGLIQLILPQAKIIDARRHPLGCCVSGFKQHYARGQNFSYSLPDLGRYYRDYVELMACYDQALPGRIHRVIYEHMVDDTEAEVRRLLDYCELPFETACMSFYDNDRAVRTASAGQVRQPIYRQGVDQWRHFEPWLDPLKEALGAVLTAYPDVPAF